MGAAEWTAIGGIFGAVGLWVIPLAIFVWQLHQKNSDDRASMRAGVDAALDRNADLVRQNALETRTMVASEVRAINEKLDKQTHDIRQDHRELRVQVTDLTGTFSREYIRRDEFNAALGGINSTMLETRREVGEMRNLLIGHKKP